MKFPVPTNNTLRCIQSICTQSGQWQQSHSIPRIVLTSIFAQFRKRTPSAFRNTSASFAVLASPKVDNKIDFCTTTGPLFRDDWEYWERQLGDTVAFEVPTTLHPNDSNRQHQRTVSNQGLDPFRPPVSPFLFPNNNHMQVSFQKNIDQEYTGPMFQDDWEYLERQFEDTVSSQHHTRRI